MSVKICPSCGLENPINETICSRCMADISSISPLNNKSPDATIIERSQSLCFEALDGSGSIFIEAGSTIGREAAGREYLAKFPTVSRKHAKLNHDSEWQLEDLNSTNGTWLNEKRLKPHEAYNIKTGDKIAFSRSCAFIIK